MSGSGVLRRPAAGMLRRRFPGAARPLLRPLSSGNPYLDGTLDDGSEAGKLDKRIEAVMNHPQATRPEYSEEEKAEHARIGRTYNVESVKWHNKMNKAIQCRIKLKNDAIANLPEEVRKLAEAAAQPEMPPQPVPIYHPSLLPFGREDAV
uniref:Uncharacterized protein n=1 Tax=Phaeomonas parva TaxID=124430 RepID=A0A7S1UD07_9STRA|mmetsp:Transcript_40704/g.127336  ORF Transcript_40704/g.127336 Transcript_40704/m.127336 type:complete len:150 (+) Transcript_40704:34-483(+)